MNPFSPSSKAARIFAALQSELGRPPLVLSPRRARQGGAALAGLGEAELLGSAPVDGDLEAAVRAGLYLYADRFEEAHDLSQKLATPEGSLWHGIAHRREPDYDNAKYWFRKAGGHPIFGELLAPGKGAPAPGPRSAVEAISSGGAWNPHAFIDLCRLCEEGERPELREELESLQDLELRLLLAFCARRALDGGRGP